ncbi:MAG: glycosyltransferase, partial [Oscillospiraceae bacterium]|nr:glycosyltransferase [Oscillospiraceae bacterium]
AVTEAVRGLDLPADVPVYLFVGRLMWYKGLGIILDALAKLRSAGSDFRMVFIGGGGDEAEVRERVGELGLSDRVFFTGPIRDREVIRAWYCRADLFLFPSTFDTNGLVVREAAACSLPSVLISGSCAAEDVTDGVNAFLIEENAESMAAMLLSLSRTPERVRKAGERASSELYLSWHDAVSRAYERYGEIAENYRAGRYERRANLPDIVFAMQGALMEKLSRMEGLGSSMNDYLARPLDRIGDLLLRQ